MFEVALRDELLVCKATELILLLSAAKDLVAPHAALLSRLDIVVRDWYSSFRARCLRHQSNFLMVGPMTPVWVPSSKSVPANFLRCFTAVLLRAALREVRNRLRAWHPEAC